MQDHLEALTASRSKILVTAQEEFKDLAVETHVLGSLGRQNPDPFSDIDLWVTLPDDRAAEIIANRFAYFERVGEIVITHEAPQNRPVNGKYSLVMYRTEAGLLEVDYFLCPASSQYSQPDTNAHIEFERDSEHVSQTKSQRLDFVICMAMNGIKKLYRKQPFKNLRQEYESLKIKHGFDLPNLPIEDSVDTLRLILDHLGEIADSKQQHALEKIKIFLASVESDL